MKRVVTILLAVAYMTSVIGCAKEKKNAAPPAASPPGAVPQPPRGGGDTSNPSNEGNEVELKVVGGSQVQKSQRLGEMFFNYTVNNPVNVRVGIAVSPEESGYGGDVWIRFEDGGQTRYAQFKTIHPYYSSTSDSSKNVWFPLNGLTVFHGFFQDAYGAIVVVIDSAVDLGDGKPPESVGGSIWFQNFGSTPMVQGPGKMCWEISIGPYDCRTFMDGGDVHTTQALYPDTHGQNRPPYKKLGDFSGMVRSAAFSD